VAVEAAAVAEVAEALVAAAAFVVAEPLLVADVLLVLESLLVAPRLLAAPASARSEGSLKDDMATGDTVTGAAYILGGDTKNIPGNTNIITRPRAIMCTRSTTVTSGPIGDGFTGVISGPARNPTAAQYRNIEILGGVTGRQLGIANWECC
jgi:hypothetical protein